MNENAQKCRFLKNFFQTLWRATAPSLCRILACDTALESFNLIFKDGNIFQVCAHIIGTHTTERIFKQNFEISENHHF